MTFTRITHQFNLFDYNAMRPRLVIPIKKISRARYDQALSELRAGRKNNMVHVLEDIHEALEKFDKRLTNGNTKQTHNNKMPS